MHVNFTNYLFVLGFNSMAINDSPLEAWEQEQTFRWIRANQIRYPKLQLAYSTLNGVRLPAKLRADMKRQGNRKGVLDIVIPAWSYDRRYCGLYVEMKRRKGGKVSEEQKEYIRMLLAEGYQALVAKGWNQAVDHIKKHLGV